jgi:hypothetical protein
MITSAVTRQSGSLFDDHVGHFSVDKHTHCDLYVATDELEAQEVMERVRQALEAAGIVPFAPA